MVSGFTLIAYRWITRHLDAPQPDGVYTSTSGVITFPYGAAAAHDYNSTPSHALLRASRFAQRDVETTERDIDFFVRISLVGSCGFGMY